PGQLERVAAHVGPLDDLVALVVVAEDEQLLTERGLGVGDPRVEFLGRGEGVAVRQRSLQSQHGGCPPRGVGFRSWPAGTAWSPTAGLSATEPICCRCYQAGTQSITPDRRDRIPNVRRVSARRSIPGGRGRRSNGDGS